MKVKIFIPLLCLSWMFFLTGCNGIDESEESSDLTLLDVHGAGAQRSDPKAGNPDNYPEGHGPQGDVVRIYNYVRPVRDISASTDSYPIVDTAQYLSATEYLSTTMNGDSTVFGVNFADGRIKGYPISNLADRSENEFFVIFVRDNDAYGENDFTDNGDGTVSDEATGLMWLQDDSGSGMDWAEDLSAAAYSDWRLPNAKELQSLVDYTRSPDTHDSAAIDPIFNCSSIIDEDGSVNYPFYWTSTTHADCYDNANYAVYLAFGEALGYMDTGDS